jgi:hypothetical protein
MVWGYGARSGVSIGIPSNADAKAEITRFNGFGEISPKEFAQFIGKEMVLAQGHHVEYAPPRSLRRSSTFT